jgi:hypothetical protein
MKELVHERVAQDLFTRNQDPFVSGWGASVNQDKIPVIDRADARTRTGDPFFTSVDHLSSPVVPSRAKPHESKESASPRWRPKTGGGKHVDPA